MGGPRHAFLPSPFFVFPIHIFPKERKHTENKKAKEGKKKERNAAHSLTAQARGKWQKREP